MVNGISSIQWLAPAVINSSLSKDNLRRFSSASRTRVRNRMELSRNDLRGNWRRKYEKTHQHVGACWKEEHFEDKSRISQQNEHKPRWKCL